jgi:Fe-S-cluster containining protein
MDCKKCHEQCKAACCTVFFIPKEIFDRNLDKIVTQPEKIDVVEDVFLIEDLVEGREKPRPRLHIVAHTEDLKCCFLNKDLSCNIYEDRPYVCRKFGDESNITMTCSFQAKDGRIRSRQERRKLERIQMDNFNALKKKVGEK